MVLMCNGDLLKVFKEWLSSKDYVNNLLSSTMLTVVKSFQAGVPFFSLTGGGGGGGSKT